MLAEPGVIPALVPLAAVDARLAGEAGQVIGSLWRNISPSDLAWLDDQVRHCAWTYGEI